MQGEPLMQGRLGGGGGPPQHLPRLLEEESLRGGPDGVLRGLALDPADLTFPQPLLMGCLPVFQVPILIPCHRVVRSTGAMGNYTGGVAVKEWLLAHEGSLAGRPAVEGAPTQPEAPAGRRN